MSQHLADAVHDAARVLNQRMMEASRAGLRVEVRTRRPDALRGYTFVDVSVSLELVPTEPSENGKGGLT